MPAFNFYPEHTAIITTPTRTPPIGHPFATTFAAAIETTLPDDIPLPLRFAVPDAAVLPVRAAADDCDDASANGVGTSKVPPGHGGTPPGQAKKTCGTSTTLTSTSSTTTPATTTTQSPAPTQSPTSTAPIQPTATSESTQGSSPASTDGSGSATSTDGGQNPSNTQSSNPQESTSGPGSDSGSAPPSSTTPSSSSPLFASSDPTANQSPLPSTPASTQPSSPSSSSSAAATPAAALSAGSAIGIALGVFAATALLVAGAVVLFLSLRRRRRRRRGSSSAASTASTMMEKRNLRAGSSEGAPSMRGPLSSTWSWFGTLPIGSESASDASPSEYKYGYGYGYGDTYAASTHTRDDPLHGVDAEKNDGEGEGGCIEERGSRARTPPAGHLRTESLGSGPLGGVGHERQEGMTDNSTSSSPLYTSHADAMHCAPVPETAGGARARGYEPRDPFADPRASVIGRVRRWIEMGRGDSVSMGEAV